MKAAFKRQQLTRCRQGFVLFALPVGLLQQLLRPPKIRLAEAIDALAKQLFGL